jgi:hypothetical protein
MDQFRLLGFPPRRARGGRCGCWSRRGGQGHRVVPGRCRREAMTSGRRDVDRVGTMARRVAAAQRHSLPPAGAGRQRHQARARCRRAAEPRTGTCFRGRRVGLVRRVGRLQGQRLAGQSRAPPFLHVPFFLAAPARPFLPCPCILLLLQRRRPSRVRWPTLNRGRHDRDRSASSSSRFRRARSIYRPQGR